MQTQFRDIAVFLDNSPAGTALARHAARLAGAHAAHLIGIYGLDRHADEDRSGSYVRGQAAISQMVDRQRASAARKVLAVGRDFAALTGDDGISSEFRIVWRDGMEDQKVLRGLHSDLIVAAQPKPEGLPAGWTAAGLMQLTGTPLLLIPQVWQGDEIGQRVLIAWNRSREARRVVGDAMPFLHKARQVTILTVDPDRDPDREDGGVPGANLQQHLARHGIAADLASVAAEGDTLSHVLATEVAARGADMLILGASGRSRASTLFFGGTSRALMAGLPVPMVLSR